METVKHPKEMTELEFEAHIKECFEIAERNAWTHIIEELPSDKKERIRKLLTKIDDLI